jgi:hypothetical protein
LKKIAALERLGGVVVGRGREMIIFVRAVVRFHAAIGDPAVQRPISLDGGDELLDALAPGVRRSVLEAIFDQEMLHRSLLEFEGHPAARGLGVRPAAKLARERATSQVWTKMIV